MSVPSSVKIATLTFTAALAVSAGLYFWLMVVPTESFSDQGVSFSYPKQYEDVTFSAPKGIAALLRQDSPVSTITLALEKGAALGAKITKSSALDYYESNADKSLPTVYKDYARDDLSRVLIAGKDASLYAFHYTGKDGRTTVYTRLYILPRANDAYYLTVESTSKNSTIADSTTVTSSLKLR